MATQIQSSTLVHTRKRNIKRHSSFVQKSVQYGFRILGSISPKITGKLGAELWFSPRRYIPTPSEQIFLDNAEEKFYFTVKGKRVVIYAWGYGPSVLLMHGWGGRAGQMAQFVKPLLEKGFSVVCFDAPAHGNSDGEQTNIIEMGEIIEFIAEREQGLHAVIAHSFGAMAASHAFKKGVNLEQAVFISPAVSVQFMMDLFRKQLGAEDAVLPFLKKAIESKFPFFGPEFWHDFDLDNNAADFTFPGLIISDSHDVYVPASQLHSLSEKWEGAKVHTTHGLGHHKILKMDEVTEKAVGYLNLPTRLERAHNH